MPSLSAMDTFICVFHVLEVHTMAFHGNVKPERWNHVLKLVDDMMRIVVSRALGEGFFKYNFTWRTNSDIIGYSLGV